MIGAVCLVILSYPNQSRTWSSVSILKPGRSGEAGKESVPTVSLPVCRTAALCAAL